MEIIHLRQTLPQVFADRDAITSDVWHQDLVLRKGERYLIEAASGTGKSSLCSYIYGYRHDYQGIINFDERNIRSLSIHEWVELRKHSLSMLFQELRIFPELTALENVQLKNRLTNYKKKKEIASPQYPPCSYWTIVEGDRVRHIDETMFQQYGILIVTNKKGEYAFCFVGDPYNMNIQTFKINELTKAN